jgi:tRNA1(Val) A37 N6-methylase TrmN6
VSGGTLLGGRVVHVQAAGGHRSGIEPVLLAAFVPARPGERVLEFGSGAGAGLLCLAARVAGARGVGVEIDPGQVALAAANAAASGLAGVEFVAADVAGWRAEGGFDHAMANPPWHGAGTASPDAGRERAKRGAEGLLAGWIAGLARPLRHRGTLSLVVAAAAVPAALAGFAASGCGGVALLPLWPRAGLAAKLVLLRAAKGARGPFRVMPGLVLHDGAGFTAAAEAVLRDGVGIAGG